MSNSTGEGANGFHLLGMDQLAFEVFLFFFSLDTGGNIPCNIQNDPASAIGNRPTLDFDRD